MQSMVSETLRSLPNSSWFGRSRRNAAEQFIGAPMIFILPICRTDLGLRGSNRRRTAAVISSRFCGGVLESGLNRIVFDEPSAACNAAAVRECIADQDRLQTSLARQVFLINSQSRHLLSACKSLARPCNRPCVSTVPLSFKFVLYTVRVVLPHGHA
jgi:hypothetical protein